MSSSRKKQRRSAAEEERAARWVGREHLKPPAPPTTRLVHPDSWMGKLVSRGWRSETSPEGETYMVRERGCHLFRVTMSNGVFCVDVSGPTVNRSIEVADRIERALEVADTVKVAEVKYA